ncbi:MAG: GntR family transcriptional regulator [Solirubrobacterales bacterium]|nr:GntR family transcriptional regulator [Solirubrobacterales bacterium]
MDRRTLPSRVRDQLLALFEEREMRPGDRIPSEGEVSELCDVGRSTAREALKLLEQEGLVEVQRGRGRFLSSLGTLKVERPVTRFESVTEMLGALGYEVRTVVLSIAEGPPTDAEATALGVSPDTDVVRLERLRCDADDPLIYSVDTFPRDCIQGPIRHIDWTGSLNALLAANGHHLVSSAARLQAVELPADVAARFSLAGMGPWLLITETAVTHTGRRALYAADYHRGDAFAFNVVRH